MQKPNGYDEANTVIGGGLYVLPLDNYICKIVDVQETVSKKGQPMLKIAFDIAEGDYTDFYKTKFMKDKESKPDKAKWSGDAIYYQLTDGDSVGRFKGVIKCLEESNPKWVWDWNEKHMVGCRFAGQFRNEPSIYNGKKYDHTKLINIYPISEFEYLEILSDKDIELPPDKEIEKAYNTFGGIGGTVSDDQIPF